MPGTPVPDSELLHRGDPTPATCKQVSHQPPRLLKDASGIIASTPASGVTRRGMLFLASRKQAYIDAFAAQGLTICEDFHPFDVPNQVLRLALQKGGGPPPPPKCCYGERDVQQGVRGVSNLQLASQCHDAVLGMDAGFQTVMRDVRQPVATPNCTDGGPFNGMAWRIRNVGAAATGTIPEVGDCTYLSAGILFDTILASGTIAGGILVGLPSTIECQFADFVTPGTAHDASVSVCILEASCDGASWATIELVAVSPPTNYPQLKVTSPDGYVFP